MKRYLFSITIILFCNSLFAQTKYTNEELKLITDSILKEGELLYKLEKSSWWTSDFAKNDNKIKKEMKTYFSYVCNDTIKCIILNEKKTKVLLEAGFIDAFNQPEYSNTEKRDLTPLA